MPRVARLIPPVTASTGKPIVLASVSLPPAARFATGPVTCCGGCGGGFSPRLKAAQSCGAKLTVCSLFGS